MKIAFNGIQIEISPQISNVLKQYVQITDDMPEYGGIIMGRLQDGNKYFITEVTRLSVLDDCGTNYFIRNKYSAQ